MKELADIIEKYENIEGLLESANLKEINAFALVFFKDVADIYDCVTRIKNISRNPTGFSLDDAPILGL